MKLLYSLLNFDTRHDLQDQEVAERIPVKCVLDTVDILTCAHARIADYNIFQFCPRYRPGFWFGTGLIEKSDCNTVTLSATAARRCAPPTNTPTVTATPTVTTTTLPKDTEPPRHLICEDHRTRCADGFVMKCSKLPLDATISWYNAGRSIISERKCYQTCVKDATCGGWQYFEEFLNSLYCYHTHDTFSSNTQFRIRDSFYSVGARGICK